MRSRRVAVMTAYKSIVHVHHFESPIVQLGPDIGGAVCSVREDGTWMEFGMLLQPLQESKYRRGDMLAHETHFNVSNRLALRRLAQLDRRAARASAASGRRGAACSPGSPRLGSGFLDAAWSR